MPVFRETVEAVLAKDLPDDALLRIGADNDEFVASVGTGGPRRARRPARRLDGHRRAPPAPVRTQDEHFLLLTLVNVPGRVIGRVLEQNRHISDAGIAWFLEQRVAAGEPVDAETFSADVRADEADELDRIFDEEPGVPESVRAAFKEWKDSLGESELRRYLGTIGTVWQPPYDAPPASLVAGREEPVARIADALAEIPAHSIVLVGEHGVGKSALLRAALDRHDEPPLVFEASASEINAGMSYIGELEGRVRDIAERLRAHAAVWVLPRLEEALFAGQHARSPQGLLDAVMPYLENGDLVIAAEASPGAWQLLVKSRPRLASLFTAVRVPVLGGAAAQAVCADALERSGVGVRASSDLLAEASELAEQFLPGVAPPGALLTLVGAAAEEAAEAGREDIDSADVLRVLSRASRLPLAMLDPDAPLDTEAVRGFLPSASSASPRRSTCIVERVALVKAGLTDPTRPLGVLLFVGPTGTGKTEIAKTLAEYLFGSASRLDPPRHERVPDARRLERLLRTPAASAGASLIASVRADPFAVVLLDEFEKAASPIWDVFLQVFDDGRLTDLQGAKRRLPPLRLHPHLERRLGHRARVGGRLRPARRSALQPASGSSGSSRSRSGPSSSTASTASSCSGPSPASRCARCSRRSSARSRTGAACADGPGRSSTTSRRSRSSSTAASRRSSGPGRSSARSSATCSPRSRRSSSSTPRPPASSSCS